MSLHPLLKFKNADSTQDLNDLTRDLFNKGIFYGGAVEPAGGLSVKIVHPFATIGTDGMFVREDDISADTTLAVTAGVRNYIVLRQKYVVNADPVISVERLSEADYNGDPDKAVLVVFAAVDVPVGASAVTTAMIDLSVRDTIDTLGRLTFRGTVTDVGALPADTSKNNRDGDFYVVTSGSYPEIYAWNGTSWVNITQTQLLLNSLQGHLDNLTDNRKHLTNDQAEAALGSVGTPSSSNKYVLELDPRLPSQNENDALQGDNTMLSGGVAPSDSNRYITSAKIFAIPAEKAFTASAVIEIKNEDGPIYVGTGTVGTAQAYFNIHNNDTTGADSDKELINSQYQAVRITGVYTNAALTSTFELNPALSADALGFFSGASLFLKTSYAADVPFRVSYGKKTNLGDMSPQAFLLRGPQGGQVDASVAKLLSSDASAQFADSLWDGSTSPGDVVAYVSGTGFVQADLGNLRFPVGVRGNSNNLIMEGLYTYPSATAFVAGDEVYADATVNGGLSLTVNDRFIGTFISPTELLVNMNAFAISPSAFVPGIGFPASMWGAVSTGEVVAWDPGSNKFVAWEGPPPLSPPPFGPPLGIRGNSNNLIQDGLYTATGSPYVSGTRYYAADPPGSLTTTQNNFFIGKAISANQLVLNVVGQELWENAQEIFGVEHTASTGVHSSGSARVYSTLLSLVGPPLSNSNLSSTGMVAYTETGQVFYCVNGATNIWQELSKFAGPIEIADELTLGGDLTLSSNIIKDATDSLNVFAHAARHFVGGKDPLPGLVNQILSTTNVIGTTIPQSPVDILTLPFDFSGRPTTSKALFFAVVNARNYNSSGSDTRLFASFYLNGSLLSTPYTLPIFSEFAGANGYIGLITLIGYHNNLSNTGSQSLTVRANSEVNNNVLNVGSMLIMLDLGTN